MRQVSCGISLVLIFLVGLVGDIGFAAERDVIAVGNPSMSSVAFFNLPKFAQKMGVKVVTKRMGTFSQAQQAVELGAADIGHIGYVNLLLMAVTGGKPKARAVSGVFVGSEDVVFHKDVKIGKWKDIEGKKVGRIPGSFAEFRFRVAAAYNGADLSKVKFVNFGFSYATLNLALKRRDVDALVIWAPGLVMPIVEGFGYRPKISIHETPIGNINGVLGMNSEFMDKNPGVAEKILKAFVEATEFYRSNHDEWVKEVRALTGADLPVVRESLKYLELTNNMYLKNAKNLAKIAFEKKLVKKDVTDNIGNWIDYKLLMKVTGKSRGDLGG